MEWAEYKTLCDRPDYQSKWLIKQTLELVRAMGVEEVIDEIIKKNSTFSFSVKTDGSKTAH